MSRSRRLVLLAAAVAAAAVVAAVAISLSARSGGKAATSSASSGSALSVLAGVPQHGNTLGRASAPATLVVFEDPQCPYCQQWALDTFPTVVQQYVATGKLKLVYRGVEIIGPNSVPALRAIAAAAQQNKLWNLVEELYQRQGAENSGWVTQAVLRSAASSAGVDATKMLAVANSKNVTSQLTSAAAQFNSVGAPGTPTFVIEKPSAPAQMLQVTSLEPQGFTASLSSALQQ
jgi:protein-disulfide isomerase